MLVKDLSSLQDMSRLTDEQLLKLYRRGRTQAFAHLVLRYKQELFHFLVRFVGSAEAAEDVFQDTFLQLHLSAHTFDTNRPLKPWLFAIGANKARDYLRMSSRRGAAPLSAPLGPVGEGGRRYVDLLEAKLDLPEQEYERRETEEQVAEVLARLPDHQREVLLLTYFHRFTYKETAQILRVPLGTVKSRLHSSVAAFAWAWKRDYGQTRED